MVSARRTGLLGEVLASRYLRDNDYEIVASNYAISGGEIDLIARRNDEIIFIEVKSRSGDTLFSPAEAVDFAKENRVRQAAAAFLAQSKAKERVRFDIIEVIFYGEEHKINHIENAF